MEKCNNNNKRKRVRDDDSPESKLLRVDSDSEANSSESQLTRVNSCESYVDSVEPHSSGVNEIQDDILNMLDDTDNVTERETTPNTTTVQGLDSVMKSFEDQILAPGSDPNPEPDFGEFKPNLGYLLEASDDELGLPPTVTPSDDSWKPEIDDTVWVGPEGFDLTGFLGFEEDIRNYEAFGLVGYGAGADDNGGGYVTIDGLFDYAEPADILWRLESLQAM